MRKNESLLADPVWVFGVVTGGVLGGVFVWLLTIITGANCG